MRRPPTPRPGPAPRGAVRLPLALALVLLVSACGGAQEGSSTPGEAGPPPTAAFLITTRDLPDGWRDSNSQGVDYRVTVCGVDIEPVAPERATSIRFSRGPVGPFLEQHVRGYADGAVPGEVVEQLRAALPGCTSYSAQGTDPGSPTATFDIEEIVVDGAPEASVAWRQTNRGDVPITSDVLLVDRGGVAVLLMSYALKGEPDPDVLSAAARALPEGP